MSAADETIQRMLTAEEHIEESISCGDAAVFVTPRRILVRTGETDGIATAEWPNVKGIARGVRGRSPTSNWGVGLSLAGAIVFACGAVLRWLIAFDPPEFEAEAAEELGVGPLTTIVEWTLLFLEHGDLWLLVGGLVLVALGGMSFVYYWVRVRERILVIDIAEPEPNIHLPLGHVPADEETALRDRIETLVAERSTFGTGMDGSQRER